MSTFTPVARPKLVCPPNPVPLAHEFANLLIEVVNHGLVASEEGWKDEYLKRWSHGDDAAMGVSLVVALLARWSAVDLELVTRRTPADPARPPRERRSSYGAPSIETWVVRTEQASPREDLSPLEMDLIAQLTVGTPVRVRDLVERLSIPPTPDKQGAIASWFSNPPAALPRDQRWFPKTPSTSAGIRASVRLQQFLEVARWLIAVETGSDLGLTYASIGRQEEEAMDRRGDALWALQLDVLGALRGPMKARQPGQGVVSP